MKSNLLQRGMAMLLALALLMGICAAAHAEEDVITAREMMTLLDEFVETIAPDKLGEWQAMFPAAREGDAQLLRADGVCMLYSAACTACPDRVALIGRWGSLHEKIGEKIWNEYPINEALFGETVYAPSPWHEWSYSASAYFFVLDVRDHNGNMLFDYDPAANTLHTDAPLTRADAEAAIARLKANWSPISITAEAKEILAKAEARKQDFFARRDTVTATGTVYYISNSGSNSNDGKSPETAWATLDRAFNIGWLHETHNFLKPGDAVLLERGGNWYVAPDREYGLTSDSYVIPDGVTLGAYGEGERPVIRCDLPQANEPDFWKLYFDQGGVKIWATAEKLQDTNVIVLNGGEFVAEEIMPHWNRKTGEYCTAEGVSFDVTVELKENLTFCSLLEFDVANILDLGNAVQTGTLFLRCDEGNPAEVFDEIALPQAQSAISLKTNASAVGISVKYAVCLGIAASGDDGDFGQQVCSCEIAWCGGLLHKYNETEVAAVLQPGCGGGAVQITGSENSVTDCYIHHCGTFSLIFAIHATGPERRAYHNMTHTGNLIEYSGSIRVTDLAKTDHPNAEGFISNLTFRDNYVLYSGEGWIEGMIQQIDPSAALQYSACLENGLSAVNNDGIYIIDNIFYCSTVNLLNISEYNFFRASKVNQPMVFSGNTYAQSVNRRLCTLNEWEWYYPDSDPAILKFLALVGDTEGTVIRLP